MLKDIRILFCQISVFLNNPCVKQDLSISTKTYIAQGAESRLGKSRLVIICALQIYPPPPARTSVSVVITRGWRQRYKLHCMHVLLGTLGPMCWCLTCVVTQNKGTQPLQHGNAWTEAHLCSEFIQVNTMNILLLLLTHTGDN